MKKNNYFSFLLSMLVMFVMASCSSSQYGAHFQSGKHQQYAYDKADKAPEEPVLASNNASAEEEEVASRAGAENAESDALPRVATLKKIMTEVEVPNESEFTAEQQAILKETRERLKNMSRKEKRALRREVRKVKLSEYTKNLPAYSNLELGETQQEGTISTALLVIITIFIPPLGVFLHQGAINSKFWLSLLLTILFYVPGLIYSLIVVLGD